MPLDDYNPSTALTAYYPSRDERRPARLWATEKLLHDLREVGIVDFFEGNGSDPTALSGYSSTKMWLRVSSGLTDHPGEIRAYDGSGDPSLLENWPEMNVASLAAFLGPPTQGQVASTGAFMKASDTADDITESSTRNFSNRLLQENYADLPTGLAAAISASKLIEVNTDATLSSGDVVSVLSALSRMFITTTSVVTLTLPTGEFTFSSAIVAACAANSDRLIIKGANPIVATITPASTPTWAATNISGNDYYYDITFAVASSAGFSVGDHVAVRVTGPSIEYSADYDMTRDGCRVFELAGGGVVSAVGSGAITVRNQHRNSEAWMPTGGPIQVTTGTITKYPTVLKFTASNGIKVESQFGRLENLAIVGDNSGSYDGIHCSSYRVSGSNAFLMDRAVGFGTYEVLIQQWGGSGIFIRGARAYGAGTLTTVADCNLAGIQSRDCARANFPSCIVNGIGTRGTSVGQGMVALAGGVLECQFAIVIGCRLIGLTATHAALMYAPDSIAMGCGNAADENGSNQDGMGFEVQGASLMSAQRSISCFNVSHGFYADALGQGFFYYCISSRNGFMGFYALDNGWISNRFSVGQNNGQFSGVGPGCFTRRGGNIVAHDTRMSGNANFDYRAWDQGTIQVLGYLGSPTFQPALNWRKGGSRISGIESDSGVVPGTLTIASGVITVPAYAEMVVLDTESAAATDDLDTINGGIAGMTIRVTTTSASRDVVVKHGTGNIRLNGASDRTLDNPRHVLTLTYKESGVNAWCESGWSEAI